MHRRPDLLHRMRQELNSAVMRSEIVVYLRSQAEYLESLYAELVRNGAPIVFCEYLEEIVLTGARSVGSFWVCAFDYNELLDSFAKVFGKDCMVVRPYLPGRPTQNLLDDFVSIIAQGKEISGLDFSSCRKRINPTLNFAKVVERLLDSRRKNGIAVPEPSSIPDARFMRGRFDPLTLNDLMRIHRRFRAGNRTIEEKYQVKIATMTSRRLLRELLCSAGLNPSSARRKKLLSRLDAQD